MDFFDPEKQKRHNLRLNIGYVVIGAMLLLTMIVLMHLTNGYRVDEKGRVIRNGLVFVSSAPDKADVYIDGEKYKNSTNTRLDLAAGQYVLELKRDGYRTWKRALVVEGGRITRVDYPLLFPTELVATAAKKYGVAPNLSTQSPDRRWLLIAAGGDRFDVFDLANRGTVPQALTVSPEMLAAASTTTGWQVVEWSQDSRHVLLKRLYDHLGQSGAEYILLDRENVAQSQNLSVALGLTPTALALRDGAYDQYYVFDQPSGQLFTATLKAPTPHPLVGGVLAFTVEKDVVVYVTTNGAETGQALVRIKRGDDKAYTIRRIPIGGQYVLDATTYADNLYVAAGSASDDRVFVYRDSLASLSENPDQPVVPVDILKVTAPNFVAFSPKGRFVIAENADSFVVYDAEEDRGYAYKVPALAGLPASHAVWVDDFRLAYASGGKAFAFDYDGVYQVSLDLATAPADRPFLSPDHRQLYIINSTNELAAVEMRSERDR